MRIANIIATGTEITTGQILNTNAAWLAQKLVDFNFEVQRHIAVDDNENRILESLLLSHKEADLVIVTGGLGPTTDDLTRKIVADWAGLELLFHETEWERIQSRLKSLDVSPREGHKWQAYFPKDAQIFVNNAGTASGFALSILKDGKFTLFWFLPGPPIEIQQIWSDHLNSELSKIGPQKNTNLLSWSFIDLAESELAHIAEPIFASKVKESGVVVGYRASPPLVELKVWLPKSLNLNLKPEFQDLENQLREYLHYRNNEDPMHEFLKTYFTKNKISEFYIQDEITEGVLFNRIDSYRAELTKQDNTGISFPKVYYSNTEFKSPRFPFLKLFQADLNSFTFEFYESSDLSFKLKVPFTRKVSNLRQKKWMCEKLFKNLLDKYAQYAG